MLLRELVNVMEEIAPTRHAESWDKISVQGKPETKDAALRYEKGGKVLALATIFRDEESLTEEIAMERHVQAS